ncbi:DUF1902 domain-containing protein [Chimaeribacter arupi]|uniref:DUF1902 domain-containing protein n=1 Tax=Nissabacter archeti TaxID=1917880 RepID=A0ABS5JCB0_9GAMM|nr:MULTISPECIES: DUF1902 domain-containing protein [Yersiniaceae]MBS0967604.1 DUF1902 domain-containing protein [Nissabacter archeti]MDV5140934.1 DUF1902 domain-containing protein [Chimaeribacter arupi]PLR32163.1 DUF1902 domain-containing protein [Chimaeribacter arupi]PLR42524.1 DUF1902 domain-containing protein [Chimaeribacter arupi]PLR47451.1 DUF1902 domain-containing protein [Chimaeribacter arupi]
MKNLRCMIYPQNGVIVAICLDLSLAAQSDSMQKARDALEEQIADYLQEAGAEPEHTEAMLRRRAPFSLWVKYYRIALLMKLNLPKGPSSVFTEPCPAL